MRSLRYSVAASLDGYIAGPNGEFDWIVVDPEIDFEAMYAGVSGLVMGRKSYEISLSTGFGGGPDLPVYVYSRTLSEGTRKGVTFSHDAVPHVRALKAEDVVNLAHPILAGAAVAAALARHDLLGDHHVARGDPEVLFRPLP